MREGKGRGSKYVPPLPDGTPPLHEEGLLRGSPRASDAGVKETTPSSDADVGDPPPFPGRRGEGRAALARIISSFLW